MSLMQLGRPRPDLESDHDDRWFVPAACRDIDQQLFFEPESEGAELRAKRIRAAKALCADCPVRRECLLFALAKPERYGIWGGYTARERAVLKRRRAARPAPAGRSDRRGP